MLRGCAHHERLLRRARQNSLIHARMEFREPAKDLLPRQRHVADLAVLLGTLASREDARRH